MDKIELSIIVPVYKVEPYLKACIDSILVQDYPDYEIILVDDGSPDNCGLICDEYAQKYGRIRVIHKENGGLSSARNAALPIAKGTYITFIDSDDCLGPDTYKQNMEYLLDHPDIDILQFPTYWDYSTDKAYLKVLDSRTLSGSECIFTNWWEGTVLNPAVWNKIYRRQMFDKIRFPDGHVFEDLFLISDFSDAARQVYISEIGSYIYYLRDNSISNCTYSLNKHLDHFTSQFKNYRKLYSYNSLRSSRVVAFMRVYRRLLTAKLDYPDFDAKVYLDELGRYVPSFSDITKSKVSFKEKVRVLLLKIAGLPLYMKLFVQKVSK